MKHAAQEHIEREINEHDVVLFMKGTPVFPQCGFSAVAVQMLSHLGRQVQRYRRAQRSGAASGD